MRGVAVTLATLAPLELILVRHATPIDPWSPGWEERDDDRPLTPEGQRRADELAFELDPYDLNAIYSSPYARAVQTVAPTAERRSMETHLLHDLRERRLNIGPRDDWAELLARSWADPDFSLPGAESGGEAQRRGMGVLDLLRARHAAGGRLLAGSHGNLISLILQALEPAVGHDFHRAMPMPAVYHLQHDGIGWRVLGGHGFAALDARN